MPAVPRTLVVSLVATAALGQAPSKSSAKIGTPVKGQVDVAYTKPVTTRDKEMVVTTIQVKNISLAPIPRLTIDETWYDKLRGLRPHPAAAWSRHHRA